MRNSRHIPYRNPRRASTMDGMAGRKKHGKAGMAKLAAAGRKRAARKGR